MLVCLLPCLVPPAVIAREKTDIVVLRNGDRLQGEIKSLKYGRLRLGTDSMGDLSIEWPDVVAVRSRYQFTVESADGGLLVGSFTTARDSARVLIQGPTGASPVPLSRISSFAQLETGFWNRIDGSVSLGFDYAKSTDIALLRSRFESRYRTPTLEAGLKASADLSTASGQETQENFSVSSNLRLLRRGSRFWAAGLSWQRNEELGIASRLQLAAGPGRYLYRSPESEVLSFLGFNGNQEWALGSDEQTLSAEAIVGTDWRTFRFRDPKTSLVTSLFLLPSLTESERYRMEFDVTLSVEVISDLTIDLTYYADSDNKPPAGGSKLDTGISTSIGYKF
jgi:uncharacterized protein DUF481